MTKPLADTVVDAVAALNDNAQGFFALEGRVALRESAAVNAALLVPNPGDTTELARAISRGVWLGQLSQAVTLNDVTGGINTSDSWPALVAGMEFGATIAVTNTGPMTVSLSGFLAGVGGVPLVSRGGGALAPGDVPATVPFKMRFDGTRFRMVGSVASDSAATATKAYADQGDAATLAAAELYADQQRTRAVPVHLRISNRLNYEFYTMQISADEVVLEDASGKTVRRSGIVYVTNNVAGANGYDANSQIVAYGNYDLYWIYNPTTNTDAGLMVTEQNGPTLPAGYTFARRLGWGRLDSAKSWHRYEQRGEEWAFKISPNMFPMTPPQVANGQIGFNGNTPTGYQEINLGGIIPARSTHVDLSLNATQTAANMIAVAPSLNWSLPATGYSGQIMFASSQDANQGPFPTNMKVRVPIETPSKIYLCQQSSCITAVLGGRLEI